MKKTNSKIKSFMMNNYLKINMLVIYFCVISMFLFLTTGFFKYVKYILIFVSLYVLFYSFFIKGRNIKRVIKSSFFVWYIILWLLMLFVTSLRNNSQFVSLLKNFLVFSAYIFDILLLYEDGNTRNKINFSMLIRVVSLVVCGWILISEYEMLLSGERIGFSITTLNPNGAGTVLATLFFALVFSTKKEKNKYDILTMLLVLFVIFATGSKHAIIMVIISLIYYIFNDGKLLKKRLLYFVVGTCLAVTLVFTVPFLRKNVGERFLKLLGTVNIINYEHDNSSTLRVKYMNRAIELWEENPVLGGGYNNVIVNSGYNTYSHNNYLEVLCTIGVIGLLYYYGYICYLLFSTLKKRRKGKYRINDKQLIFSLFLLAVLISDVGAITFTLYPFYYIMLYIIDKKYGVCFNILSEEKGV